MTGLARLLDPRSIAIAGLSSDPTKHGARVLGHLRRLGYPGQVVGINPRRPAVDGVEVFGALDALAEPPDLVVAAVPAAAAVEVVAAARGVGGVVVFAAGFAEAGEEGGKLQHRLAEAAAAAGTRVLGPNSGGVIRPGGGVAASFLTCLDRPGDEILSGPVAVVTQSGGTGSFIHNLAAARSEGLAASVATGNEADIRLGEALDSVSRLEEVEVVVVIVETMRDGPAFVEAVREAHRRGKRVVACRLGTGRRGAGLLASHTGALAVPSSVAEGVFAALGVVEAATPAEAYEVASMLARLAPPAGDRVGVVTHSGGAAILLADLAEKEGLALPAPDEGLRSRVEPLLDHGSATNPLDMGGIIGGPSRFADVVEHFLRSGNYDTVLAVSTAHPPAHTGGRVDSLLRLEPDPPLAHLWLAGDQAAAGLATLRRAGAAVTEEARAAIRVMAALAHPPPAAGAAAPPLSGPIESWGLPLQPGRVAATAEQAVAAAEELGYPVVVKVEGPAHKTEVGGVRLDVRTPSEVEAAFEEVTGSAAAAGWERPRVRLQEFRPGLEMIVGAVRDPHFGPLVSVGAGGVLAELVADLVFAPAPVDPEGARRMIGRLRSRRLLEGYRGAPAADVEELARLVSLASRAPLGDGVAEVELNPLVWDGAEWRAVDWLVVPQPG